MEILEDEVKDAEDEDGEEEDTKSNEDETQEDDELEVEQAADGKFCIYLFPFFPVDLVYNFQFV